MTTGYIQAIETVYNGYRFRSRTEARWAVFFDVAHIQYSYEPEGYLLPASDDEHRKELGDKYSILSPTPYLPDFFLSNVTFRAGNTKGIWFEVKGDCQPIDWAKANGLHYLLRQSIVIAEGAIENAFIDGSPTNGDYYDLSWAYCCACYTCTLEGYDHEGDHCEFCDKGTISFFDKHRSNLIKYAYQTAKSARFEFGERG